MAHIGARAGADENLVRIDRRLGEAAATVLLVLGALVATTVPAQAQEAEADGDGDGACEQPAGPKSNAVANTGEDTADDADAGPVDCEPPPPQVSLAYLRSPAPVAIDSELQEALEGVGFLDTWYGLTPTNPRLSLVRVEGVAADATRQAVLDLVDELSRTRQTVTSLLIATQEAVAQQKLLLAAIETADATLTDLRSDKAQSQRSLRELRNNLSIVEGALQDAAVGMYVSSQPNGVIAVDNVEDYNLAQGLAENVELTIDELMTQRGRLQDSIANEESRLAGIKAAIEAEREDRSRLVMEEQNVGETIERLTARIADLTARRIELEAEIPAAVALAHDARLTAAAPVLGIRLVTLDSYVQAADKIPQYYPGCAARWELIAGIAKIESGNASFGGAVVGADGNVNKKILGPVLDGTLEDTAIIEDTDGGRLDGNAEFDRAVGPFQFIPGTWRRSGLDATGDGWANPHNVYDAALSAAGYLCAASNLSSDGGIARSVLSYNASAVYLADVTGAARDYIVSLALPEAAYDPATLVVQDGWALFSEPDEWERIGYVGLPNSVVNTG